MKRRTARRRKKREIQVSSKGISEGLRSLTSWKVIEYKAKRVVTHWDSGDKTRFEKREKIRAWRKLKYFLSRTKWLTCFQ